MAVDSIKIETTKIHQVILQRPKIHQGFLRGLKITQDFLGGIQVEMQQMLQKSRSFFETPLFFVAIFVV